MSSWDCHRDDLRPGEALSGFFENLSRERNRVTFCVSSKVVGDREHFIDRQTQETCDRLWTFLGPIEVMVARECKPFPVPFHRERQEVLP